MSNSAGQVAIGENDFLVSKTDLKGRIIYCNRIFMKVAGYSESELLGKPHNVVRHPDMPRIVFKLLWDRVQSGKEIFAFVKNKTKNGGYYWVCANVTPSVNDRGNIIGYYSVRRRVNDSALPVVQELYSRLLQEERSGGMDASKKYLDNLLNEKGVSYDEFISSLQQ